ncbi:MAG: tail fiber domain-containing protein [Chthoniobacterales bacterium]
MKATLQYTTNAIITAACLAVAPFAQAVSPSPDGGYPNNNTAEGTDALFSLTTGANNTALGYTALHNDTTGDYNTATGSIALSSNFSGSGNTAHGYNALGANTTGDGNTAHGKDALASNTSGSVNTATGDVALRLNTTGGANTASGVNALFNNTNASNNTADGFATLMSNTVGATNTASGSSALASNTTGSNNIAVGYQAGLNLTTGDNNIAIGNTGVAAEAGKIRIGTRGVHNTTYVAGIFGSTVSRGAPVSIDNKGHLGTVTSSSRFKHDTQPMGLASNSILALQPVTYRYKEELDPDRVPQFGLVAEEVAKVNPALVVRDEQGRPYTVRYEAVNAMLLNEFLKEHRRVATLEETVAQLKSALEKQAAQIQKVSAQLQTDRPSPRVVSSAP